jgi:crotonobetainyl-CoA:carnitine CoA-transferase CaiB-like acyl-CoA transferase
MNDADIFKGIRVVDFSQGMAGPYCGHLLAQYGADVVKVEPPIGDWLRRNGKQFGDHSAMSIVASQGKRSVALDLKSSRGQALALALIARADVLLENNRPGVMARLGLDYDAARAIKPDIIYLSITGFGHSGPYANRPALDTVMQSYTGLTLANLGNDGVPHRVGILVPDMVTALYGFQSIAVALYAKSVGRGGRFLDVSLTQAMAAFQANMLIQTTLEGTRPEVLAVPSGTYPTADGWISMAVINEPQWPRLASAIGRPDLVDDRRFNVREARRANFVVLNDIIAMETRKRPTKEWLPRLEAADIPHGQVNSYADLLADPQFQAARAVAWIEQANVGRLPVAGIPASPRAGEGAPSQAPSIGEHSREILAELGHKRAEIDALIEAGVIVVPRADIADVFRLRMTG